MSSDATLEGRVIRSYGNRFVVATDDGNYECGLRGKFRLSEDKTTSPVAVGDRVTVVLESPGTGVIDTVHERTNKLSRPDVIKPEWEQVLVANCDQLIVVAAVRSPKLRYGTIDRFLVVAERARLDGAVVLSKIDLAKDSFDRVIEVYKHAGYVVIPTSVVDGRGLGELREFVKGKTSIFAGHSGVGKSSLLNALEPGLGLRTKEISSATDRGQHTTTHIELHPLSFGGFIADTPGLRVIGLWDVEPDHVQEYFPEFRRYFGQCKFADCLHVAEPGCRIKLAVQQGEIMPERYDSYVRIRDTLGEE